MIRTKGILQDAPHVSAMTGLLVVAVSLAVALVFSVTTATAEPVIQGISGEFVHGTSMTITGSNLGSFDTPDMLLWENFDAGRNGAQITGSPLMGSWGAVRSIPFYSSVSAHRGLSSYYGDTDGTFGSQWGTLLPHNKEKFYSSFWYRYHASTLTAGVFKILQVWGTTPWTTDYDPGIFTSVTGYSAFTQRVLDNPVGPWLQDWFDAPSMDTWHHFEMIISQSRDSVANGSILIKNDNVAIFNHSNIITRDTVQGDPEQFWDQILFCYGMLNYGEGEFVEDYVDDLYLTSSWARVEIGNATTYATSVHREIQAPTSWSSGEIQFQLNQGSFPDGTQAYLYVTDENGIVNSAGFPLLFGGGPRSDATPPAAVTTLTLGTITPTSVSLTWTAVGDDGNAGTATSYDLRYSTSAIDVGNWETATQVTGEPAPHIAGTAESMTVTGLSSSTTYYFALKVADEVPNWSVISNLPSGVMTLPSPDTTPPSVVANLVARTPTPTSLTLAWTAVGDNGSTGTATTYDLRYSTSAITAANFASATQVTGEPAPHVAGTAESMTVAGLSSSATYFFALKVADEVPNWSGLSNIPSGTTSPPPDTTPPWTVSTLVVGIPTSTSLTVMWAAVGDDGDTGTATTYDLRYATSAITAGNWASATQVTGEPAPHVAGTTESMTVTGLSSGTTYFFALKVADEVPNWSGLSDVPSGTTSPPPDTTPPSAVPTLVAGTPTSTSVTVTWTAVGDDGNTGTAAAYDLRYAPSAINAGNWALATPVTGEPTPHVAGMAESMTVTGLSPSTTYYFALKVADEVPNWSVISNLPSGTTLPPPDTTPPAAVTTLAADSTSSTTATLTWTAVGDDRNEGQATSYEVRYQLGSAITSENQWQRATPAEGTIPHPAPAGTMQQMTITGLTPGTTYGIGVRAIDDQGNVGGLSNPLVVTTQIVTAPPPPPPSDTTPPAAVGTLAVVSVTQTSATLGWTAVGDDGNTGTATTYDFRYSTSAINASNWGSAIQVTGEIAPKAAGQMELLTVTSLAAGVTYYFAIKVADEVPNWSALSNSPSGTTQLPVDTIAPSEVTTLAVMSTTRTTMLLSWTAVGDDGNTGTATTYDLRYSTSNVTPESFASATEVIGESVPGPAGQAETLTVTGLTAGTVYHFAIKVADEASNWSGLSNGADGATQSAPDTTSPAAVTTLAITSATPTAATLAWTAVGDDGGSGTASTYDLRYSTTQIRDENWDAAAQAVGEPAPRSSGRPETFVVSGLTSGTTYYFALKAGDEVPNWSDLSNVTTGATQPMTDTASPGPVATLVVSSVTSTTATLTWTAVGDDGNEGTAASYDLRYSTSPIDMARFPSTTQVMGEPSPHAAGTSESMTVSGLSAGMTYYFALRVADEVPNWSDLSNVPSSVTQPNSDTVPPASVATLVVASAIQTAVTLTWAATGDDGDTGTAATYDFRYSTSNISPGNFGSATQVEGEPTPSAAGQVETFVIAGLAPGTKYYFAVKVADEVGNWSGLSQVVNVRTPSANEVPFPAAITEIWITDVGVGTARFALRNPETLIGGAAVDHYEARLAEAPLDDEVWESSTVVASPHPGAAGAEVEWLIAGLDPSRTYYLAMRVYDVDGRASGLSPVVQVQTNEQNLAPPDPPGQPRLSWNADDSILTLQWSPAVDPRVAGYALYAQGSDGGWFRYRPDLLPTPSCELARPDPSVVRYLAVKSVTAMGDESALSSPADLYPGSWEIEGPFPHPVTDACTVRISVPVDFPADKVVRVEILSIGGTSEAVLHDGLVLPGSVVECHWDRRIAGGRTAPPGYHYLLCTGGGYRTLRTIYVAP